MFDEEKHPVKLKDWIRQQEMELRDKVFDDGNAKYLKVLNEISVKEEAFISNSDDLLNKAVAHSETFNSLNEDDREFVEELLCDTIFHIEIIDDK
ncbi:hypothetical protein Q3V30_22405 (plasmid) [Erwinia pyri]|uniref:Uncharacterized protein n=1 Tax=Erwinia pyri TaxID=3062598 RepID=A0AA50HQB6_9GAMM|nr:hypothetical protein [Erwinia sp. DE2]WLS81217.1 hypothetical protein Q3V30_22405 [Erwinia sp. DE2]